MGIPAMGSLAAQKSPPMPGVVSLSGQPTALDHPQPINSNGKIANALGVAKAQHQLMEVPETKLATPYKPPQISLRQAL